MIDMDFYAQLLDGTFTTGATWLGLAALVGLVGGWAIQNAIESRVPAIRRARIAIEHRRRFGRRVLR